MEDAKLKLLLILIPFIIYFLTTLFYHLGIFLLSLLRPFGSVLFGFVLPWYDFPIIYTYLVLTQYLVSEFRALVMYKNKLNRMNSSKDMVDFLNSNVRHLGWQPFPCIYREQELLHWENAVRVEQQACQMICNSCSPTRQRSHNLRSETSP